MFRDLQIFKNEMCKWKFIHFQQQQQQQQGMICPGQICDASLVIKKCGIQNCCCAQNVQMIFGGFNPIFNTSMHISRYIVMMYEVCSVRAKLKSVLTPCYTIRLRPRLKRSAVLAEAEDQEAGKLPSRIA